MRWIPKPPQRGLLELSGRFSYMRLLEEFAWHPGLGPVVRLCLTTRAGAEVTAAAATPRREARQPRLSAPHLSVRCQADPGPA